MQFYSYRIIIEPDENHTFHGYVPALPGCHTWGRTLDETRKNIRDALTAYLKSLATDGDTIPQDKGVEVFETVRVAQNKGKTWCSNIRMAAGLLWRGTRAKTCPAEPCAQFCGTSMFPLRSSASYCDNW